MCDFCLLVPLYVAGFAGAVPYLITRVRRPSMPEPTEPSADPTPLPPDRRDEIGLMLRTLMLNLGLAEARFGQSLTLDEIADGVDVTRDDLVTTIHTAFPDVDVEYLRATGTVGDVMDLILATEEDGAQDDGGLSANTDPPELTDEEKAAIQAKIDAERDEVLRTGTDAGPITGGPTTGPGELPPAAPGEIGTLGAGPSALPPKPEEPVGDTGAAAQASDATAAGSER